MYLRDGLEVLKPKLTVLDRQTISFSVPLESKTVKMEHYFKLNRYVLLIS